MINFLLLHEDNYLQRWYTVITIKNQNKNREKLAYFHLKRR